MHFADFHCFPVFPRIPKWSFRSEGPRAFWSLRSKEHWQRALLTANGSGILAGLMDIGIAGEHFGIQMVTEEPRPGMVVGLRPIHLTIISIVIVAWIARALQLIAKKELGARVCTRPQTRSTKS